MNDLDVEKLLEIGKDPKIGENALDILSMLKEANRVLSEAQKTMNLLDSLGLRTLLVRAAAKKLDIDIDTPLPEDQRIQPRSHTHRTIFEQLNQATEEELRAYMKQLEAQLHANVQSQHPESDSDR